MAISLVTQFQPYTDEIFTTESKKSLLTNQDFSWIECCRERIRCNMGGYGSGGHNKTHRQLENFHRIDSYAFYDFLMGDKYLFCKTTVQYPLNRGDIIYHVQSKTALIKVLSDQNREYKYVDLPLSRVHGIDGKSVRMYFHCPYCGRRVRYLYDYYKHYACRKCAKLNYASQQKSGMDEMRLKMERIVEKYGIGM